jgi:hypothetical protein
MKKAALFAFNGEPMCFVHVLFNALDMKEKGYEVQVVIEGSATKLVASIDETPFAGLYRSVREAGLIGCVCDVCSNKMGSRQAALDQGLELCNEMNGHPSVARYLDEGYQVFTF